MSTSFKQTRLPNGLTIIAEVDDAAHTAAAGFFVKTGARDETPAMMGVSHFLEHMMFKGTPTRNAEQVNEQLDDLGATHNAFTTSELTAFWAHTLPGELPAAIEILGDLMRPSLRPADFDEERGVILEEIAMYEDQPFWVLYEAAMEKYFGSHPLRHRVLGTRETISNMKRDEMMAYFENRYSADNTVLALAGQLDFESIVELAGRMCGPWQTTRPAGRITPAAPAPGRFVIDSESVNRCYGMLIAPAPAMLDEDRYAAAVAAQVLGDSEGSRLYWALIETGLAEDAQAGYDGRDGTGEFMMTYVCSPERADEVEATVRSQMESLSGSFTEDDLLRAKRKIATGVTLAGERPSGRMRRLGTFWLYAGAHRSLEEELERINRLTLADLVRVLERFPLRAVVSGRLLPKK